MIFDLTWKSWITVRVMFCSNFASYSFSVKDKIRNKSGWEWSLCVTNSFLTMNFFAMTKRSESWIVLIEKKSNDLSDTENFRQSPRSSAILKCVIDVKYHYKNTQNVTCDVNILINYKIRNPDTTSGQNAVNCYEFRQMMRQARKVIPNQNIKNLSFSLTQIISRTDVISQEKMIKLCSSAFRSFSFCIHNTIRTHPSFPPRFVLKIHLIWIPSNDVALTALQKIQTYKLKKTGESPHVEIQLLQSSSKLSSSDMHDVNEFAEHRSQNGHWSADTQNHTGIRDEWIKKKEELSPKLPSTLPSNRVRKIMLSSEKSEDTITTWTDGTKNYARSYHNVSIKMMRKRIRPRHRWYREMSTQRLRQYKEQQNTNEKYRLAIPSPYGR